MFCACATGALRQPSRWGGEVGGPVGERRVVRWGRWKRREERCQVGAVGSRDNAQRARGERERPTCAEG